MYHQVTDITGRKYGRWTVLGRGPDIGKNKAWFCRCECGNERLVQYPSLSTHSRSCGCLRSELLRAKDKGFKGKPEYNVWTCIIARCYNARNPAFENYGGRGIKMSDEWRFSFETFFKDMGSRPSPDMTIERIDNSKGYFKENCKWGTREEQANNMRVNRMVTLPDGEEMTFAQACRKFGLKYHTARTWYERGHFDRLPFHVSERKTE